VISFFQKRRIAETRNKSASSSDAFGTLITASKYFYLFASLLVARENWKEEQQVEIDDGDQDEMNGTASRKGQEYAQLKKDMLRSRRAIKVLTGQVAEDVWNIFLSLRLTCL
jgi:hypothetical protein